tara:strand:- start:116 stop:598 length:483 start_codon:yes stop_codon:yes gene_type:complete
LNIQLTNFFTDQLPADPNLENTRREVLEAVYSFVRPIKTSNPTLLHVSDEMQHTLDFSNEDIQSREFLEFVTGNSVLKNSKPFAMCYAGHQFGNWAGQLGDGRAINLGEIKDWAVQLKGSGPTPYSRMQMAWQYYALLLENIYAVKPCIILEFHQQGHYH